MGLLVFLRVAVILVAWVLAFVAFLLAPLVVLAVAWALGFAVLAVRRGRRDRSAAPSRALPAGTHRFGAAGAASPDPEEEPS